MDLSKLMSARFLSTVAVITTFCLIVIYSVISAVIKDIVTKDLIMLIVGAFISNVSTITTFYFMRQDRQTEQTTKE